MRLMRQCSVDGCSKAGTGRCSVCKTLYCSTQCQTADWQDHIAFCEYLPPLEWISPRTSRQNEASPERTTGQNSPINYKEAVTSPDVAISTIERNKLYEISQMEHFESLSEFSVRLTVEVRHGSQFTGKSKINLNSTG